MPTNLTDPIYLYLDDPTGKVSKPVPIPPYTGVMPFMVIGFDGGGAQPDTYAGRAATCYYVLATAVPNAIAKLGKTPKWVAVQELLVQPAAGRRLNAFFDRQSLQFFFGWDAPRNKYIYTSSSIDVIAHELGHALLDSIRPDLWNFAVPEIAAMHESFGDIHGFTTAMKQDSLLVRSLVETKGDLSRSNILSRIAEEMGTCLFAKPKGQVAPLRDAANAFLYVDPETLPAKAGNNALSSEPHSFSRVFTGCAYDIMVGIYHAMTAKGEDGLKALRDAGDVLQTYLFQAALIAPASVNFFQNFARAMLVVDHQKGDPYGGIMAEVFARRTILPAGIRAMRTPGLVVRTETVNKKVEVKIGEGFHTLANSPLAGVTVEVPLDECRHFDAHGKVVESFLPDQKEASRVACHYADVLAKTGAIGGHDHEFRISPENRLVRNHISCGRREVN